MKNLKSKLKETVSKGALKASKLLPPAILTALMLNFASCASTPDMGGRYEYNSANSTIEMIADSNLTALETSSINEADVREELKDIVLEMNKDSAALSHSFMTMEKATWAESGLTADRVKDIMLDQGTPATQAEYNYALQGSIQHYMHLMSDVVAMLRVGATEAELQAADEFDGRNEFMRLITPNGISYKDTEIVWETVFKNIPVFTNDYKKLSDTVISQEQINSLPTKLESLKTISKNIATNLTSGVDQTQNFMNLDILINDISAILPNAYFGDLATRKAMLNQYASQVVFNEVAMDLEALGYNVTNLTLTQKEVRTIENAPAAKTVQPASVIPTSTEKENENPYEFKEAVAYLDITNTDLNLGGEVHWDKQTNSWHSTAFGASLGYTYKYADEEKGKDGEHWGTVAGHYKNQFALPNNQAISLDTSLGLSFSGNDQKYPTNEVSAGVEIPFNLGVKYMLPIDENFGLETGLNYNVNLASLFAEYGAAHDLALKLAVTYQFGKVKTRLSYGHKVFNSLENIEIPEPEPTPSPKDPIDNGTTDDGLGAGTVTEDDITNLDNHTSDDISI